MRVITPAAFSPTLVAEAVDFAPDAVAIIEAPATDIALRHFIYVNNAFERLYECDRATVIGQQSTEFFRTRISGPDAREIAHGLAAGIPFQQTRLYRKTDRTPVWIEVHFQPVPCDAPEVARWIFISRDVSQTRALQSRMEMLATAVEHANDLIAVYTADGETWRFEYVNDAFAKITGFSRDELIGSTSDILLAPEMNRDRLQKFRTALLAGQTVREEMLCRRKDGQPLILEFNSRALFEPATGTYDHSVTIFRDVTQQKQAERQLQYTADHDTLTGAFNRAYVEAALHDCSELAVAGGQEHSLLFIDLDGFKSVNDMHGHKEGDVVLCAVARRLRAALVGSDIFARWGGDEFVALLYHCNPANALLVGQKMITLLEQARDCRGVGASIGVVRIDGDVADAVRKADAACYRAKREGRNRVVAGDATATQAHPA
ncbi:MAG: diguanylate cyclase [Candidatus Eremiobacteraeota bacterium]|nr:diguanylate cyclase [Candidatus Eremiobacteraeota bacterium]